MDINLKEIKFDTAIDTSWVIFSLLFPPIVALQICNPELYLKADLFKILLSSASFGSITLIINYVFVGMITLIPLFSQNQTPGKQVSRRILLCATATQNFIWLVTIVNEVIRSNFPNEKLAVIVNSCYRTFFLTNSILWILWVIFSIIGNMSNKPAK